ncbi:translation elongation factor Ts [bacterium]|nr:translation elongation factor Ts [bacterium]
MEITSEMIKKMRTETGAGILDCKKALNEADGSQEKAIEILRKKGISVADSKFGRETVEGLITSYIHFGGKIGVLLEVNCETDFVARTEEFQLLVKDISMHIAAMKPRYISKDDVEKEVLEKEKEIYAEQARAEGKPEKILDKIVEGKLNKFYSQICLLNQAFVKDPDITIQDRITQVISKIKENIRVKRYVRWEIGKD